jgi:hypothetical protein
MSRFIDLTGLKFSHLTVLGQAGRDKFGRAKWLCECDCPEKNQIITWSTNLRTGNTESCGCVTRSQRGLSHDASYDTYRGIIRRCEDPNDQEYHNYGRDNGSSGARR